MHFLLACLLGSALPATPDTLPAPSPTRLVLYVHPLSPVAFYGWTQGNALFLKGGVVFDVPGVRNLIVEGSMFSWDRREEKELESWETRSPRLFEQRSAYQSLFLGKRFQWMQLFVQPTLQVGRWEIYERTDEVVDVQGRFAAGMLYVGAIPRLDQWRMEVDFGIGRKLVGEVPFAYPSSDLVLDANARFGYAF